MVEKVKFFCSHGGKILPRPCDSNLKYIGGETRYVVIPRSITFSELMKKINNLFEGEYVLKHQIGKEDLDCLVSVKSDEDIRYMLDEYDRLEREETLKLRTFVFPIKPIIVENRNSFLDLKSHVSDQRFIEVVRSTNYCQKRSSSTIQLSSFSSSPTEDSSPQSISPSQVSHNYYSSMNYDNSLIVNLQNRLTRIHKVQSSPNMCSLSNPQNSSNLFTSNYKHSTTMNNDFQSQYHQHNYHGYQSQKFLQHDHIQLQDYYMNLSPQPLITNRL
ncbi:unnamed protein product [Amaranthus hypochondriacus]